MSYYTVTSIVKKDIKSPGLHYGWHLQIKLIFYTKKRIPKPQNQDTAHKRQQSQGTDYWSKKLEHISKYFSTLTLASQPKDDVVSIKLHV